MANRLYDNGRDLFANGDIDWVADTIKVTLVDGADYTPNTATHLYMNTDTIPAAGKLSTVTLAGKSTALGVVDANDIAFPTVTGDQAEYLIIWKDGGGGGTTASGTTDPLIAIIDTATGLPVTPNGTNINVTWDSGANKIFKL